MAGTYRDNYPFNIEAPQRVYVQYSQDINFDYSGGKYPLGETHEGFVWENIYVPVSHYIGDILVGKHVWMRWRIGEKEAWTLPMRLTDSILNIETTSIEYETEPSQIKFKFKYTLDTGEIVYSEYMYIPLPEDGRGISNSQITNNNLILTYTDGTSQNVGRVVGYDGTGVPIGTTDYNILISLDDEPQWISLISQLNNNLSGTLPIIYSNGVYSHSNNDGYRHIPVGGNNTDCLITDGSGNYTWDQRIPFTAINDSAGIGDVNELWSADKIATMFSTLQTFGIKYSVELIADLALIVGMEDNDLAVVNEDRYVYQYDEGTLTWSQFFLLDAPHNHDSLYYRKTELSTSGLASVHWDNITNIPSSLSSWDVVGNTGSTNISNGETLSILGSGGVNTVLSGNTLTITATGTTYTEGSGIDISGTVISHENTSDVSNTTNTYGQVIQNLTFDEFGHVQTISNVNLDYRYGQTLTRGLGLTGSNYNGSVATTWNVDFAGSGGLYGTLNTVARSDHNHTSLFTISTTSITLGSGSTIFNKFTYDTFEQVTVAITGYWLSGFAVSSGAILGTVPLAYRPTVNVSSWIYWVGTTPTDLRSAEIWINGSTGVITFGRHGDLSGNMRNLSGYVTYWKYV